MYLFLRYFVLYILLGSFALFDHIYQEMLHAFIDTQLFIIPFFVKVFQTFL